MSIDFIQEALESVRYPLTSAYSLPPSCYHDVSWFKYELDRVFKTGWFSIGRVDQWQRCGDYQALNIAGIPIVIVMDEDGKLQAMSNTCLHRSSEIMSGQGSCKVMVCPFHGWSYDYQGQVISAPHMEVAEGFCQSDLFLKKFKLDVSDGFVFLSLDDDCGELEDWLGDFPDVHACWSMHELVTTRQRSFEVNCNWKLFIEVFNEYYHLPYVHSQSIGHYYPEPEDIDAVMGEYTTQFGLTTKNPALLETSQGNAFPMISTLGEKEKNGTRYTWIYPNITFAASVDCMWAYHVYPISPNRTLATQTVCFSKETTKREDFAEKAQSYYERFDEAINEDIPALEKQQSGMESPYARQGRFSALEPSVANFACWYADMMRK